MNKDYIHEFQNKLLDWYDENRRILPWREEPSAYKVWISEIMLQQTRVDTVIPYFLKFMEDIPSIFTLANISEDKLLKLWEGLGYYSRAKNLKKAAQVLLEEYNGQMPSDKKDLQSLPGIGPYTSGAIASIAFGQKEPAMDGNVLRIVSRITVNTGDIKNRKVKADIEQIVIDVLPENRVGDFNQALMDLGATICIPNGAPKCSICPLSGFCEGHNKGIAETLPVKTAKKKRNIEKKTIFVLNYGDQFALKRRPNKGLLSKLWEYPNVDGFATEKDVRLLMKSWGFLTGSLLELNNSKHLFSHIEWHMKAYYIKVEAVQRDNDFVWASKKEIKEKYSIPTAFKEYTKWVQHLEEHQGQAI
ncbi:A/G-specific adenine glycosylase [Alkalibaculum bacchi]|uniref:A/G-specific adenine glycosylase n=1 Tax=Alkalibaculum bacchi TaxID=645887 RepID=UPI0026EAF93D|nr:A/G-specific adenine glycosylase [Alkalibaculum bacchi]